ncbi:glutathione S-transferase [Paucibacter oligotrophus]|uniref:Glutathione S-transferase n=1 Tax=Roseateles oligotrophus TaxID=1769250 RepID=A0A840LBR2_9BURK|nr:glutathione S-transferase [Roseateles oligotrophus]MBB4845600.1 glutathione S-transferase [Roseateles oligotrophus]
MNGNTLSSAPSPSLRLHHYALSGHSHRVHLFLSLLRLPVELRAVDLPSGQQKSPAFLRLNPFGQVPVLEDGELVLADSQAILVYLALRYDPSRQWLPEAAQANAEVQRWLSAAAGPLAFGPAHARVGRLFNLPIEARAYELSQKLFTAMEERLREQAFIASRAHATIADLALYGYTAAAPEGGILLDDYPAIQAWLGRIEALPDFIPMPRAALPATPGEARP